MDLTQIEPSRIDPSLKGKSFLFYGEYGTRKTSVASLFPRPIFAQTENGTNFIDGIRGVKITSWSDMVRFMRQLKRPEVQELYDTVVFDMASKLYDYAEQYTINGKLDGKEIDELGFGKGYKVLKNEYARVIDQIQSLGYGIVFIAHDKVKTDLEGNEVSRTLDLEKNPSHIINGIVDFTFHLKKEKATVVAYSQTNGKSVGKSRARYFPSSFEFTFKNLETELATAIEEQVKIEKIELQVQDRAVDTTRSFEEVKQSTIQLVTKLQQLNHPIFPRVVYLIQNNLGGNSLSNATELYYNQILTIETYIQIETDL